MIRPNPGFDRRLNDAADLLGLAVPGGAELVRERDLAGFDGGQRRQRCGTVMAAIQ
jgi:hypothetical protein